MLPLMYSGDKFFKLSHQTYFIIKNFYINEYYYALPLTSSGIVEKICVHVLNLKLFSFRNLCVVSVAVCDIKYVSTYNDYYREWTIFSKRR